MKATLLLLFACVSLAFGEPSEISLKPNQDYHKDYGEQLIEKFSSLLESDKELKAQFEKFETAPKERAGGRYMGPAVRSLLLHRSEDLNDEGNRNYTQKVVLYYSFREGFRKGMEETSGIFAVFQIAGHLTYAPKSSDDFEIVKHTVTAKFEGFRKTLEAEKTEDDKTDSRTESK